MTVKPAEAVNKPADVIVPVPVVLILPEVVTATEPKVKALVTVKPADAVNKPADVIVPVPVVLILLEVVTVPVEVKPVKVPTEVILG